MRIFSEKGFSFVEIMVILTIIGLILGIALPNYLEGRSKTVTTTCTSNQKFIYTAATMYMMTEDESLEEMGDAEKLSALKEGGYIRGDKWAECPSSRDESDDDYEIIMDGSIVEDVECKIKPSQHKWP